MNKFMLLTIICLALMGILGFVYADDQSTTTCIDNSGNSNNYFSAGNITASNLGSGKSR